jgi:hypothetical protein
MASVEQVVSIPNKLYNGQYPIADVSSIMAATTSSTIPHPVLNPSTPLPATAPTPRIVLSALSIFPIFLVIVLSPFFSFELIVFVLSVQYFIDVQDLEKDTIAV